MIISCYAREEGTPYDGLYREASPEIPVGGGGGTQQIIVRGGSALRSNPVPSRKRYIFVTDSCFMTAHFQQLRGIQSSKQGMWKEYHLSIEGIRNREKWFITWLEIRLIKFNSASVLPNPIEHADDINKLFVIPRVVVSSAILSLLSASITRQYKMKRLPCVL